MKNLISMIVLMGIISSSAFAAGMGEDGSLEKCIDSPQSSRGVLERKIAEEDDSKKEEEKNLEEISTGR